MPNRDGTGPGRGGGRNSRRRSPRRRGDCRRDGLPQGNGETLISAATALLGMAAASLPVFMKFKNLLTNENREKEAISEKPPMKTIVIEPEPVLMDQNKDTDKIKNK